MGLALALQARGHDVGLATSEFYRQKIEGAGLEFSAIRPLVAPDDARMLRQVMDSRNGPEFLIRTVLMPHLRDMYEDVLRATKGADFLISGEVVLAASLVAEKQRLPWAGAILAPFSFFSVYDPPVVPLLPVGSWLVRAPVPVQQTLLVLAKWATREWGEPIHALRHELGLRATGHPLLHDRFSPFLNLALFSDVLGKPQSDWPAHTAQAGFIFYDQPEDATAVNPELAEFLANGPPPVTFTLGSAAVMDAGRFFEESAAAARELGRRAVLLMGKNPQPAGQPGEILAIDYAPYSQVFPHSACVVHQGGVGTTAQALRAGIPQLIMPYAFDQPDNAARVARIGTGLSVTRQRYQGGRIARILNDLLTEPHYRRRARQIGDHISAQDGLGRACDSIEQFLRDNNVTRPPATQTRPYA
jgi:rhamnosyltransferase subunit B